MPPTGNQPNYPPPQNTKAGESAPTADGYLTNKRIIEWVCGPVPWGETNS